MLYPIETFGNYMFNRSSPISYVPNNSKYTYSYHSNAFTFLYSEYTKNLQEKKLQKTLKKTNSKSLFMLDF